MYVVDAATDHGHNPGSEISAGVAVRYRESPRRAEMIRLALAAQPEMTFRPPDEHGLDPVLAVHDPDLVRFLERAWQKWAERFPGSAQAVPDTFPSPRVRSGMGAGRTPKEVRGALGYWCFDTGTPIVAGTWPAARAAAEVALTAAELVLGGEPAAYGLCRPPGHHAARGAFGGYCYLNNAAIAAERLARASGGRVSVLDLDYHHGNGTQQIFYERADVQYVSLHGDPDRAYPYFTGYSDEVGGGAGRGATLNLPLPLGCGDDEYLASLTRALEMVDAFSPELAVVSFGADTAAADPLGDLRLSRVGFARAGAALAALRRPFVVVQEGGYAVDELGANVAAFLGGLLAAA